MSRAGPVQRREGRTIQLWLPLVAVGLLLTVAVIVALGAPRNERPAAVVATGAPPPTETTGPTLSGPTRPPATPTPTLDPAQNPDVLDLADWEITLERPVALPWAAVRMGFDGNPVGLDMVADRTRYVLMPDVDGQAWDLYFGSCSVDRCAGPLITLSLARRDARLLVGTTDCAEAPANIVFDCLASNDLWPVTITGTTVEELRQAWVGKFGEPTVTRVTLGGQPALVLERGVRLTVLAVHGDVAVALVGQPGWGSSAGETAAALDAVIAGIRFAGSTSSRRSV